MDQPPFRARSNLASIARTTRRVPVTACNASKAAAPRLPEDFYGTVGAVRIDQCKVADHPGDMPSRNVLKAGAFKDTAGAETIAESDDASTVHWWVSWRARVPSSCAQKG